MIQLFSFLMLISRHFQQAKDGTLTVSGTDFNNDKGYAIVYLFRKDDKIPALPFRVTKAAVYHQKAQLRFTDLPFGNYALILLHDENANEKIDHAFGLPKEPLGYSNHWKLGFFTGMPTFSKLQFSFSPTSTSQIITITYKKK